jgi:hypothetical protein
MAATGNDQVQALVYFNGWMCDEGESQQQLLERFEGSLVGPSIRPVPYTAPDGSEGTDLFLDPEMFHEAFAADVDPETAAVMAAAQRPYAAAAFAAAPSGPPGWKTLPCWYLLGTEDKAIPPALQRFMAERANATIVEVAASHVSFVSQPEAATQLILQAVEAPRRRYGPLGKCARPRAGPRPALRRSTRAGTPCQTDAATCGWHTPANDKPAPSRPRRAETRSVWLVASGQGGGAYEYKSRRLRYLNEQSRFVPEPPDGDGGEPMPWAQ